MTTLCFIDTETTGLDARIHQPYEVCYWREDEKEPRTRMLGHDLVHADQQALAIGRYWERNNFPHPGDHLTKANVALDLRGVTLVGSNPAFDAAMLTRYIGAPGLAPPDDRRRAGCDVGTQPRPTHRPR